MMILETVLSARHVCQISFFSPQKKYLGDFFMLAAILIILNREMKIVSSLLLCQNIFFYAKNIGILYIFYNQLIFNTYDGNNCFIIPKNILRKIA